MVSRILKISTSYCPPCKLLKKELEDFDLLPIESIDADADEEACEKYNVRGVPVLIFLDSEDKEVSRRVGFISKTDLINLINELNK